MEAPFDIKQRFPPEDQPIVGHLGKFIISFVQSLLKIGHFQSSDAKSVTAKEALFQEWRHLVHRDREVSFIIQNQDNSQGSHPISVVFVYGILSEITPLEKLFSPDMADLFTPKVFDYFNRRYLSGFTLKPDITFDELDRFIEIIRDPVNPAEMDREIQAITEKLVAQQVVHASVIYAQELFVGKTALHFMTQMALTRFEKELRTILLHTHLTNEQKMALKASVFKDMLVPLSDTVILKEMLIHSSLIDFSLWDAPIDIETEIAKGLGKDLLWQFLLESAYTLREDATQDSLVFIIKKFVLSLSLDKLQDDSEAVLEILLQDKVVTLLEIPEPVLDRVYLKRKTNDYLQNKEQYWETLQAEGNGGKINDLMPMLPILLKQNEFASFGELLGQMRRARKGEGQPDFLAFVGMESMRETILSKIHNHEIPNRKELFAMLEPFSLFLYKSLLPSCADNDILLRRNICKLLVTAGRDGVSDLIAFGNDSVRDWQTARNVVMILGEIGSTEEPVVTFLKRCQRHPNLRVREEVILSCGKMKGSQIERMLLKELENPDILFQGRAIIALEHFHPMNASVQTFIEEALKRKRKNESETDEHLQVQCCMALETIARFDPVAAQYFEPILCNALTPSKSALFGWVGEKYHEKGYEVKKAICRLLGEIGTKAAFPLVGRLITEKYWRPEDRALIQEALQKIEHRVSVGG